MGSKRKPRATDVDHEIVMDVCRDLRNGKDAARSVALRRVEIETAARAAMLALLVEAVPAPGTAVPVAWQPLMECIDRLRDEVAGTRLYNEAQRKKAGGTPCT